MAAQTFRLQVTLPAPYETQLKQLGEMLHLNPSDVVEEALGMFFKAVLETRRGRHVAFVDDKRQVLAEYSSPSLTRLEWDTRDPERIVLSNEDFDRLTDELNKPAKPIPALQALAKRHAKRRR